MALRFIDGFDHYNVADIPKKWTSVGDGTANTPSMDAGRVYGQSFKQVTTSNGVAKYLMQTFPTTYTRGVIGFALKTTAYTWLTNPQTRAEMCIASITNGGSTDWFLSLNSDGSLSVYTRGGIYGFIFGGIHYFTAGSVPLDTWVYLEWEWNFATNYMALWISGVRVGELTDVGIAGVFNTVELLGAHPYGVGYNFVGTMWVDDCYLLAGTDGQTATLGDMCVHTRQVLANGAENDGTPVGAGSPPPTSNECVDELLADVADYVTQTFVGELDLFVVEDIDGGANVNGVQVTMLTEKAGDGSAGVASVIRASGTNYQHSVSQAISVDGRFNCFVYENDPLGVPWDPVVFNAAEFGFTKTI